MKKLFGLLSVCLALPWLSACSLTDGEKEYQSNENEHWRSIELFDSVEIIFEKEPHTDLNADGFCDVCRGEGKTGIEPPEEIIPTQTALLVDYETWLGELTADEIGEVKTTSGAVGVQPGLFKTAQYTRDESEIERILKAYQDLKMVSISREDAEVAGGGAFTVEFILKDYSVKKLYFNNGNYDATISNPEPSSLGYFKVGKFPKLGENKRTAYEFITYNETFELFTVEGESLGLHDGLDKFSFIECTPEQMTFDTAVQYYMVGDVGTLYVHSDYHFSIREDGRTIYYQIDRGMHFGNFDQIKNHVFGVTDGVLYRLKEDGKSAEVYGYDLTSIGHIIVQNEYQGVPVTAIADYAFAKTNVGRIVLPETITYIGKWAFFECVYLKSVNIPDSVTEIDEYAFHSCNSLANIEIPDSVEVIGDGAFRFCRNLSQIKIGKGLTSLGNYVFGDCESLVELTLPEGITTIGTQVILGCKQLRSITIPKSVSLIVSWALYDCENLIVYYRGTIEDWRKIVIESWNDLEKMTICYYSEQAPSENFWHYDESGNPVKW